MLLRRWEVSPSGETEGAMVGGPVSRYFAQSTMTPEQLPSLTSLTLPVATRKGQTLSWQRMPLPGWLEGTCQVAF